MNVIGLHSFVDSTTHPIACHAPFLFYSHATTALPWLVTYFFRCYLWCIWVDWLCRRLILGAWVTNWYLPSITDLLLSSAHLRSRVYYLLFTSGLCQKFGSNFLLDLMSHSAASLDGHHLGGVWTHYQPDLYFFLRSSLGFCPCRFSLPHNLLQAC